MNSVIKKISIFVLLAGCFVSSNRVSFKHGSNIVYPEVSITTEHFINKPNYALSSKDNFISLVNSIDTVTRANYLEASNKADEALEIYNNLTSEVKAESDVKTAKNKLDTIINEINEYKHIEELVTLLHMDEDNPGQCNDYYNAAKEEFLTLTPSEQQKFQGGEYSEEWSRFHAWITANGEYYANGKITSSLKNSLGYGLYRDGFEIVSLILIFVACVAILCTVLVVVKKKVK